MMIIVSESRSNAMLFSVVRAGVARPESATGVKVGDFPCHAIGRLRACHPPTTLTHDPVLKKNRTLSATLFPYETSCINPALPHKFGVRRFIVAF